MRPSVRVRHAVGAAVLLAMALPAAGCGQPGSSRAGEPAAGPVTVLAAASLTEAFTRIGAGLEARTPGTQVTFSFGSSATLATQIVDGAPADVFAAANESTMQQVVGAGLAERPTPFAVNTLQIAVPGGNPGRITGLADFADPRRRIALCAPQVPCGSAATKVFAAARVTPRPDTLEQDVKAALQKVLIGEVDAALVYRTDVQAAGAAVQGIDVAQASAAANTYPIVVLTGGPNPAGGRAFVDYLLSADGRAVLSDAGFGRP